MRTRLRIQFPANRVEFHHFRGLRPPVWRLVRECVQGFSGKFPTQGTREFFDTTGNCLAANSEAHRGPNGERLPGIEGEAKPFASVRQGPSFRKACPLFEENQTRILHAVMRAFAE